eukprot:m.54325 g.54325  ORF g.54325 m.54325 type:complete len:94 (+) comp7714_c2_seq4:128-409(+)
MPLGVPVTAQEQANAAKDKLWTYVTTKAPKLTDLTRGTWESLMDVKKAGNAVSVNDTVYLVDFGTYLRVAALGIEGLPLVPTFSLPNEEEASK